LKKLNIIFLILLVALVGFYLVKEVQVIKQGRLVADETLYAYFSQWIAEHKALPRVLPEFYGGFTYGYPPLLHILGAVFYAIGGTGALYWVNFAILILFISAMFFLVRKYFNPDLAILTVLITLSSWYIFAYAGYFLTEMLSVLFFFGFFLFFSLSLRDEKVSFALLSGLSLGLMALSKQSGFLALAFCPLAIIILLIMRDFKKTRLVLFTFLVALLICRNHIQIYWNMITNVIQAVFKFIPTASENPYLAAINTETIIVWDVARGTVIKKLLLRNGILISVGFFASLGYVIARIKKIDKSFILLNVLLLVSFIGVMLAKPAEDRHFIFLVPLVAFLLASIILKLLKGKAMLIAKYVVLIITFVSVLFAANPRKTYSMSPYLQEVMLKIKEITPKDSVILTNHTYEVLFYSERATTWPTPNATSPTELFYQVGVDDFYQVLKKYDIDYIFLNKLTVRPGKFNSFHFPQNAVTYLSRLADTQKVKFVYNDQYFTLIKVN